MVDRGLVPQKLALSRVANIGVGKRFPIQIKAVCGFECGFHILEFADKIESVPCRYFEFEVGATRLKIFGKWLFGNCNLCLLNSETVQPWARAHLLSRLLLRSTTLCRHRFCWQPV